MKKVLVMLVAVAMLAAFAGSAAAVTCTIDHKPAATLLIPYFQTSVTAASECSDGGPVPCVSPFGAGLNGTDTLITVVNASAADTLAHVTVWNRRSAAVLDFNIGLTGFDEMAFSMGQVLTGRLPNDTGAYAGNACSKSSFVRFTPVSTPAPSFDPGASTVYPVAPNTAFGAPFSFELAASLDGSDDCLAGGETSLGTDPDVLSGYVTIDMVNYCTFGNPNQIAYWIDNAAGFENSLWGDYIIESEGGVPTFGLPAIGLEADVVGLNGSLAAEGTPLRTFYARYWEDSAGVVSDTGIDNGGAAYFATIGMPDPTIIIGDMREPLGVTWGARYLDIDVSSTSFLRAWRASADELTDLLGGSTCSEVEPNVFTVVWDEDETPNQQNGCTISPCPVNQPLNFPFETQRTDIAQFAPDQASIAGWVYVDFGANGTVLDQAYLGYDMQAPGAFVNAGFDGVQFDANSCVPARFAGSVVPVLPAIPTPANADGITGASGGF
jgi:hypothetical protein